MRINKYVAQATGLSRRTADDLIAREQVRINGVLPSAGHDVQPSDIVTLGTRTLTLPQTTQTILLNKPAGYVVSREGQGSRTVYDLLPKELHHLKPIGRLDKDSSGLLLLTSDGELANQLTHPRYQKTKVYEATLNKPLRAEHKQAITTDGVKLEDGPSRFGLHAIGRENSAWTITMQEGRNRQIRRTFEALGYSVTKLHRTQFGNHTLSSIPAGKYKTV